MLAHSLCTYVNAFFCKNRLRQRPAFRGFITLNERTP